MLLDNHITFARKIKEAILAMRVSQVMSKQQILDTLSERNLSRQ